MVLKILYMEQVFGSLNLSKEILLNEMAIILVSQQLSEYKMKNDYYYRSIMVFHGIIFALSMNIQF